MESDSNLTLKRQKNVFMESHISCRDLNELPEHLIIYILSFLHTKEAIKTSILSKIWKYRWTSIFNLNINDDTVGDNRGKINACNAERFIDWVDKVLIKIEHSSIHKFVLALKSYSDSTVINKWISTSVLSNVRDLRLILVNFCAVNVEVAASIFHCKNLEILMLENGLVFTFPEQESVCLPKLKFVSFDEVCICKIPAADGISVCFPKLKTLQLRAVKYLTKDDSATKLVSNCPVLEDLLIRRPVKDRALYTDLCIPALSTAILDFTHDKVNRVVVISSPVKTLRLNYWSPYNKIFVQKHDSLIEATLDIYKTMDYQEEQKMELFRLVTSFYKVYRLRLSTHAVNAIKESKITLATYCNLVQLELDLDCKDFCMLHCLLHKSINLRTLIINKTGYPQCLSEATKWNELSPKTKCLEASLKNIEINGCNCCVDDVAVIKSLLKCAEILKKLTIKPLLYALPCMDPNLLKTIKHSLKQEILAFPRASADVDFVLL